MTQEEALTVLKTGANVFLTGEPGSGKTYTINRYVSYLRSRGVEPAITASTGIAATHIGGFTIHSWSGIGIKPYLTEYDLEDIANKERLASRIMNSKVLIIDEISMLSGQTLSMIDAVCRAVRRVQQPFGGLQVVFVGDFFQLPPILKSAKAPRTIFEDEERSSPFAFHSHNWEEANPIVCYLSEQHRQEDSTFLDVLSAIRSGSVDRGHEIALQDRFLEESERAELSIPKLFTHNIDVDRMNEGELGKIQHLQWKDEGPMHLLTT